MSVPSAPTITSNTPGDQKVTIVFTAPASGAPFTNYQYSTDNGTNWVTPSPVVTTTPILITGLTNGTSYTFKLRAVNATGSGTASAASTSTPRTVPDTPTGVAATSGTSTIVSVSWVAPVNNGGSAVTAYKIERSTDQTTWTSLTSAQASSPYSSTGLTNGTLYYYKVSATNAAGFGAVSSVVSATPYTTPAAPTLGTITLGNQQLSVAFTAGAANGSAITNYEYSIDNGVNWVTPSPAVTATPVLITGLTNGTSYTVKLRAVNAAGSGATQASGTVAIPRTVPDAPTGVAATPGASTIVSVSWVAPVNNGGNAITLYKIERSTDQTTWTSTTNATSPYNSTGLTNGTLYYYRISATNAAGYGTTSTIVSATPRTVPGAPTGVTASAVSSTSASVAFTAPASNGGNAITSYIVTPYIGAVAQTTTSGSSSPITISGLTTGQSYTFKVNAVNDAGNSALSTASTSLFMSYSPMTSPSGVTLTYLTSVGTPSKTVIDNSTVRYTNVAFADVVIDPKPDSSGWTITYGANVDTLIKVRKIILSDKIIYLLGSGSDAATSITNSSATVGSQTMSRTNLGGNDYLWHYNVNALLEYNTNSKQSIIYFAGDTIYSPSTANSGIILNNVSSPMSIIGKMVNEKKPLLTRSNYAAPLFQLWSSNVRIENIILDFNMTSVVETGSSNPIDIIASNYNLDLIENITFKNVDMQRFNTRGINIHYSNNVTFDNCVFARPSANQPISIASGKNVVIKNCTIPKGGASQLNWSSILINSTSSAYIYASGQSRNSSRSSWTDAQKLEALDSSIDLSEGNTFTDDATGGYALIKIDSYRAANGAIQPNLTYTGQLPKVKLPAGFGYAFSHNAASGITIPTLYITKNSTDITGSSTTWGAIGPSDVTVRNLSTNSRIYPDGYELATNTVVDPSTLTNETAIPINIGGIRTEVPIKVSNSLTELNDLEPVFLSDVSSNLILSVFTSSDAGAAVLKALNNNVNNVSVERIVKGESKVSSMNVNKRSAVTSAVATKVINGQTQSVTADITSLPSTSSIILSVDTLGSATGLKSNIYFKPVDGSGNIISSNFSIPIDFVIPGTDSITSLDLYRYDTETNNYVKLSSISKKANTTNTFSYTFTSNSDYQLLLPAPSAPTIVDVASGDQQLEIDWTKPSGDSITSYKIYRDGSLLTTVSGSPPALVYLDTNLTNGTSYSYTVSAVNETGEGAQSTSLSGSPDGSPFAPTSLSSIPDNQQVKLSWSSANPNGGSILKYNVYYRIDSDISYNKIDTSSIDVSYNLTGLTNGTSYNVYITAVDQIGESNGSSIQTVTPRTVPDAPTIGSVTPGNQQLSVAFTAPLNNGGDTIIDYEYSANDGTTWSSAASTSSPIVITGLNNGTTYDVKLRAVNSAGSGFASSKQSGTPRTVPGAPTIVSITPGNQQLSVAFTAPLNNGGDSISNYEYSTNNGMSWSSASSTSSPIVITGLANGTTYNVKLRAVNGAGSGLASSTQSGTPKTVPDAPTISSVTPGNQQLSVAFTSPMNNGGDTIIDYEYSTNDGSSWSLASSTYSPIVITGLTNGTTYDVKLRAVNSVGSGTSSLKQSGKPRTFPGAPTIGSVTSGNQQLSVAVTAPLNNGGDSISNYEYSTNNGMSWSSASSTSSPIVITGLTNGTTYNVKLRAVNGAGSGLASSTQSGTPKTVPGAPTIGSVTSGDKQLSVTFSAPTNNGGDTISNYEYSTNNGSSWSSASSTSSPIVITGLTNGTTYNVKLRAVNGPGSGPASSTQSGTPKDPVIDFVLDAFNGNLEMKVKAILTPGETPSTIVADAVAVYEVTADSMKNAFYFESDSRDLSDDADSDIKYYVNWPSTYVLNPAHAYVSRYPIATTDSRGVIDDNRMLVKHDFLRHIAQSLFNTHLAVDLFSNEEEVLDDIASKGDAAWRGNIKSVIDAVSAGGNHASQGGYTTNALDTSANLCKVLFKQITQMDKMRFASLDTLAMDASANNLFYLPFKAGDSISFKVVVNSDSTQGTIFGGNTPVPSRSYHIKLNMVNANPSNVAVNDGTFRSSRVVA